MYPYPIEIFKYTTDGLPRNCMQMSPNCTHFYGHVCKQNNDVDICRKNLTSLQVEESGWKTVQHYDT